MKIVYLLASSALSGGAKVVFQHAEELARRGHAVTIASPDPRPDWFPLRRSAWEEGDLARSRSLAESEAAVATFWTTVAPAVARAGGAVFHLCQGYEASFQAYAPFRERILEAYGLPTRKLALTPPLAGILRGAGHGEAAVIGQAFDAGDFAVPPRPERPRPSVLVPGIDEGEIKGVREALAALAALRGRGLRFRVLRVSAEPVSRWERDLGVTDEYHRAVPPSRMPRLYARADVFVGASHAEEGFDLPALEALASALPAALSDTPAHRYSAGDAAVWFAAGDAAGIAEAVERLLGDAAERSRLALLGPPRAARFRTADVADRLESEFEAALRERRTSR